MAELIPYLDLPAEDRAAIHAWLTDHRVDYTRVPVYARFDFDAVTGEWRIPIYWHDAGGRMGLASGRPGERLIRQHVIRRRELRPLPWPKVAGLRLCPCADDPAASCTFPALTDDERRRRDHVDACWDGCDDLHADLCEYCELPDCLGDCWGEEHDGAQWPPDVITLTVAGDLL